MNHGEFPVDVRAMSLKRKPLGLMVHEKISAVKAVNDSAVDQFMAEIYGERERF